MILHLPTWDAVPEPVRAVARWLEERHEPATTHDYADATGMTPRHCSALLRQAVRAHLAMRYREGYSYRYVGGWDAGVAEEWGCYSDEPRPRPVATGRVRNALCAHCHVVFQRRVVQLDRASRRGRPVYCSSSCAAYGQARRPSAVLALLRSEPGLQLTAGEIARRLDTTDGSVREALRRLRDAGRVDWEDDGLEWQRRGRRPALYMAAEAP